MGWLWLTTLAACDFGSSMPALGGAAGGVAPPPATAAPDPHGQDPGSPPPPRLRRPHPRPAQRLAGALSTIAMLSGAGAQALLRSQGVGFLTIDAENQIQQEIPE